MFQVIDWLPTLLSAAGYDTSKLPEDIDGMDQWNVLSYNSEGTRTEMLHNTLGNEAALRMQDLKIIKGQKKGWDGWYPPEGSSNPPEVAPAHMFESKLDDILRKVGREPKKGTPLVIVCGPKPVNASTNCDAQHKFCMFNITADPCEYNNIADQLPDDLELLRQRLEYYRKTAVPPRNKPNDPAGDPIHHNGTWVPWIKLTATELAEASLKKT